jgi:hypothetical protein
MKRRLAHQLQFDLRHFKDEEEQNEPFEPLDESVDDAQREDEASIIMITGIRSIFNDNDNPLDRSQQ